MKNLTLAIGNKNYSSWSLRPWLLLKHFNVDFQEVRLALDTPEFADLAQQWSPTRRVPVLAHGHLRVWDSMAICEYINEALIANEGWPVDVGCRARARSIVAEMHAGFSAMRLELPMNVRRSPRALQISDAATADLQRITQIWTDCLLSSKGPWLFGKFSIADAFYAPVAFRLRAYAVNAEGVAKAYVDELLRHPAMLSWAEEASAEVEVLSSEER